MRFFCAILATTVVLSGCGGTTSLKTSDNLPTVQIEKTGAGGAVADATTSGERYDAAMEEAIARRTLEAWRIAVKHSKKENTGDKEWQTIRAEDEKNAMAKLDEVKQEFPTSSTVRFMMGQVKDHFGKHAEAADHFQASIAHNRHNSMYLFKLAESQSRAGQHDQAIATYRRLLEYNSEFAPAQVGLSRSLLSKNANDPEAKKLLQSVIEREPDYAEAKSLLGNRSKE